MWTRTVRRSGRRGDMGNALLVVAVVLAISVADFSIHHVHHHCHQNEKWARECCWRRTGFSSLSLTMLGHGDD